MTQISEFAHPALAFGQVSAEGFARIMAQVADVALVLDADDGRVRDVAFGTGTLAADALPPLAGRALADVVTTESREKVEALLADADGSGRPRHVNLPVEGGDDVPVSLKAFGLGGGRVLMVGRDERQAAVLQRRFIAAQRDLEQNHARLRQADARFRTMLHLSDLAVLTLDGRTMRILDASAEAAARFEVAAPALAGQAFAALIARDDATTANAALVEAAAGSGRIGTFAARTRGGEPLRFQVAGFRYEQAIRLLVRVIGAGDAPADDARALLDRLPHGVAVADARLRVVEANPAFAELAGLAAADEAVGRSLDEWVGRGGVDTDILRAALRDADTVHDFASVMGSVAVDVDAVRIGMGEAARFGFLVRRADPARRARPLDAADRAGLVERMTEVVGRVSLKEIVRDTTDVIEKLCIETALDLTDDNRAAASDMLGISRQSLYAKLARYGIGGGTDGGE